MIKYKVFNVCITFANMELTLRGVLRLVRPVVGFFGEGDSPEAVFLVVCNPSMNEL